MSLFFSDKGYVVKESNGDRIKVKLIDNYGNVYFKGSAQTNNPIEMKKLVEDLKMKGVPFDDNWF